ncbi:MAG: pyridoxamine 5'-phosphate oxidase family protein [Actinomycetia bacterium]|nr:pyridoxamine 5'-phosphate oxidase family protein [Actinomycetes bacterium]
MQVYPALLPEHVAFIRQQPVFFVASSPLSPDGHVNLSPKGYDTFAVLSPTEVAYLDLTGSGNETSGHVAENGRITFMFCAFTGPPRILRLYGRGEVVLPETAAWDEIAGHFGLRPGAGQIIRARIYRVQTSCGFGVPLMTPVGDRPTLARWAERKGPEGLRTSWQTRNGETIDGLPTPLGRRWRGDG